MDKFTDVAEWPAVAKAKLVRGKFHNVNSGKHTFEAVRYADERRGRFLYDLYLDGELYLPRVNPLFLEFLQ